MASRIAFALADLRAELQRVAPEEMRETVSADIYMEPRLFELVEGEIRDRHNGAKLPLDKTYRGQGTRAIRYAGLRLVLMPMR